MFDSDRPMRVLGISGSLRKGSYNTAALRAAGELMPDDMELELADLNGLPMYNADDEKAHGVPTSVEALRQQVAAADCLLIATPEYNYSITGAPKNAIDWLSRPRDPPINLMPAANSTSGFCTSRRSLWRGMFRQCFVARGGARPAANAGAGGGSRGGGGGGARRRATGGVL